MAVTKLWPVKVRLKSVLDYVENEDKTLKSNSKYSKDYYNSLKDVIAYAKNEEKTEKEYFCEGINCNITMAREQFITVKKQFQKEDGIQAYHGYISFKEQNITPELAQEIGMKFVRKVWGERFQAVVTTHLNTSHLHCHYVINSVSFVDGKKLQGEEKAWFKIKDIADEICKEYGLNIVENPSRYKSSSYMELKDREGYPTRYNIARSIIDEAISRSESIKGLEIELKKMGYGFNFNPNHKYWTITLKGSDKPIRLFRLGDEYTNKRICERLIENRDSIDFAPFQPKTYKVKQYKIPTREDKIKKVGGLYGLYLYYCYRLGSLPKYKKQNPARIHYLLRDDLLKLNELTAQTQLLSKNNISNTQELFLYKESVEDEIKKLTVTRTHLRNHMRTKNISDKQLVADKKEVSLVSEALKELRKDLRLCEGIEERSGVIKNNLEKVIALEEQEKRKEKNKNEYRW